MNENASNAFTDKVTPVILAGGRGTRLRSVVSDRPKVLAEVAGRPFIAYLLDRLAALGFRRCVVSTGYMADLVKETLGPDHQGMELTYSHEEEPLGTGGGLVRALPLVETPFILAFNGDSFVDADLAAYLYWFFQIQREAALLLAWMEDGGRYGRVEVADEQVLRFHEKDPDAGPGWINAGVYLLNCGYLSSILAPGPSSIEKDFFERVAGSGLWGMPQRCAFLDIGTPASYARAEAFLSALNLEGDRTP